MSWKKDIQKRAAEIDKDLKRRDPSKPPSRPKRDADGVDEAAATLLSISHQVRDAAKAIRDDIRKGRE